MGVDCRIMLPSNVRLRDVGELLGILSGRKSEKQYFNNNSGWSVRVAGMHFRTYESMPECVAIEWDMPKYGGRSVLFHYESGQGQYRLLMPPSTCWWLAAGKRLISFFGGELDYNDCDNTDVDFQRRKKSRQVNAPEDGKPWYIFQERMLKAKAITEEEIQSMVKHAGYGDKW